MLKTLDGIILNIQSLNLWTSICSVYQWLGLKFAQVVSLPTDQMKEKRFVPDKFNCRLFCHSSCLTMINQFKKKSTIWKSHISNLLSKLYMTSFLSVDYYKAVYLSLQNLVKPVLILSSSIIWKMMHERTLTLSLSLQIQSRFHQRFKLETLQVLSSQMEHGFQFITILTWLLWRMN